MSDAAETALPAPDPWVALETAAQRVTRALAGWRQRAEAAEAEVVRLRDALEQVTREPVGENVPELRRLRAENALLRSRTAEARTRTDTLLAKLALLEVEG